METRIRSGQIKGWWEVSQADIPNLETIPPTRLNQLVTIPSIPLSEKDPLAYISNVVQQRALQSRPLRSRVVTLPFLGVVTLLGVPDLEQNTGRAIWIGATWHSRAPWEGPDQWQSVFVDSKLAFNSDLVVEEINKVAKTLPGLEEATSTGLEGREVFVIDSLKVFYRTEQAGAWAVSLIQGTLTDPERLPGLQPEDIQVLQLADSQEPAPYTIVVKTDGEFLPQEEKWKQNHVAVITLNPQMTLAWLIQEALAQWTGRPVGEILQIEHENGRLRIYA